MYFMDVFTDSPQAFAKKYSIPRFFETSAKEDEGIDELFRWTVETTLPRVGRVRHDACACTRVPACACSSIYLCACTCA
jgi:hypothetical protein